MKTFAVTKWLVLQDVPQLAIRDLEIHAKYGVRLAKWQAFKEDPRALLVEPNMCIVEVIDFKGLQFRLGDP